MRFRPTEVLFSPSARCNLACGHCDVRRSGKRLAASLAAGFLSGCRRIGVRRVGFTGGEPFLEIDFMCAVTEEAVRQGLLFGRVMTNGVWWRSRRTLEIALCKLRDAGYDGSICVSVDAFHNQSVKKLAYFIKRAVAVWRRPDIVSIAYVTGVRDAATAKKLKALDRIMRRSDIFIRKLKVNFSSVGKALRLRDPWDGRWFKEDFCKGPGNVFFIMPNGDVKPCCGYANERDELTIGNIKRDTAKDIMNKAHNNRFVRAVFCDGLSSVRKKLESSGVRFPGRTSDHCYFCDYLLGRVPRKILWRCLAAILLFFALFSGAEARHISPSADCKKISARVVRKIEIPRWYHEGLFYDGENLWLANGEKGKIWVLDVSSGKVLREIEPVADFPEALIRREDGALFTTEWYSKKIYRVRLEGDRLASEAETSFEPAHPAGLAWDGRRFYVVTWRRGLGTKFDLVELDADLNIVSTMPFRGIHEPDQLAWDGKYLWVSSWYSRRVYRINMEKRAITGYFDSPADMTTGIAWDGKYMWLTGTYSDLYQIEIEK
ncbi:MAG: SPASM domain-containing protein [Candidatus Omnitrophica bacterium]|nr:SPASM domain-containing protein [Candidatus Omnitrophota bacterium]MCM8790360.1 SPASM domain-containing protein [Candidatus Omnitrophota bacterium]